MSSNIAVDSTSIKGWKMFPASNIPELFNYGHVYHYLVESVAAFGSKISAESSDDEDLDTESGYTATAKPLKKGRSLVNSGFVRDMQDYKNEECYFLRAHVHHSMKNELALNVNVVLSNPTGFVKSADCDCKASSLGRCAHVSSVLLTLVDYIGKNSHTIATPSTSKPCTWNHGKKREKNPTCLHESNYNSKKFKDSRIYNWDPRPENNRDTVNPKQINEFILLARLQAIKN